MAEGGRQLSRRGLQGETGKVSQGAFWKAPNPRLDSILPVALAVGDYWKILSRGVIAESLVWGRNR